MADPRDQIFSSIHQQWLKPMGFRKHGRKSALNLDPRVVIEVALESYPAAPGGPYRFSIEVKCRWRDSPEGDITGFVYLPSYATKEQFWSFTDQATWERAAEQVEALFRTFGVPTIQKMQSLEGLLEVFQSTPEHVSLHWYYGNYYRLLDRLGRPEAVKELLLRVIETASNEGAKEYARELLNRQEALPP